MIGRLLAACGWLAWQVGRPFGARSLRRLRRAAVVVVAVLLLALAALPIVVPQLDAQPTDLGVQDLFDGAGTETDTWVRLDGRLVPLEQDPARQPGDYALLVDAARPLRAIAVRADDPVPAAERTVVTGRVVPSYILVEEELPIEATVAGTPPQILTDRYIELDATPRPARTVLWPLSILPALLGALLLVGVRAGYPIFRPATVVDVLAAPLGPGERLPTAYGGRIGPNTSELAEPAAALLLVRRGPQGNLLTAQPLSDGSGPAPAPVTIGGGWSTGRIGEVYTVNETVPALRIRSELVDATFLFARTAERDRVASLVTVDR